ncbi:MAG: DUF3592 domain-containing protein [Hyphomicrobium sp.]
MKLEVNDDIINDPTAGDLRRAFPSTAPNADWSVALTRSDDDMLEADGRDDGAYELSHVLGNRLFVVEKPMSAREVHNVFEAYLEDRQTWRDGVAFVPYNPKAAPGFAVSPSLAPWLAGLALLASLAFAARAFGVFDGFGIAWPDVSQIDIPLPAALDSPFARVLLALSAVLLVIGSVAAIANIIDERRLARWPSVQGRIVRARDDIEQTYQTGGGMPSSQRTADIGYTYTVGTEDYEGRRIGRTNDAATVDVDAVLARFPIGQTVQVFYDPADPRSSVLDNAVKSKTPGGCLQALAVYGAFTAAAMWLATNGEGLVKGVLPNAVVPLFLLTLFGALVFLGLFAALARNVHRARRWPKAFGVITRSEVITFTRASSPGGSSSRNSGPRIGYKPVVHYRYSVNGRQHIGHNVELDSESGGSESFARKCAARYPLNRQVIVRYDPENPARAALEFRIGIAWVLLVVGLLLAVAALFASGVLA